MPAARARRGPVLLLLAAVLVVGGIIDRQARSASSATTVTTVTPAPVAAPASAGSSAWYCTGSNAAGSTAADGSVVVANAGDRPLTGTITVLPTQGESKSAPLDIPADGRQAIRLSEVATAPFASAVVELDGGEAVAELTTAGALGDTVAQCASAASDRWYFADGVTTRDASETLLLFNPFPDDAVVDVIFTSDEGQVRPERLTGLAITGRSTAAISVNEFAQRREVVATSITARSGRLVAARQQAFDGSAGRKGMAVTLGAAAPSERWYFPEGRVSEGVIEQYHLFNPANTEANVEVAFTLDQGSAEPMLLTVPPQSQVTVKANDEPRIPKDVAHAAAIRSLNSVPVVAERTIDSRRPGATGVAMTVGARTAAPRWAVAAGQADAAVEESLIFQNPGGEPATVSVALLADGQRQPIEGLQNVEVTPGGRRGVRVNATLDRNATPMVIEADHDIVVERDLYRVRGTGIAMTMGIQLRD